MKYEWDEEKDRINLKKHGITLKYATKIFLDPYRIDYYDEVHSGINIYGVWEDRYIAIVYVENVLYVVYTMREEGNDEVIRIISARPAVGFEIDDYISNREMS